MMSQVEKTVELVDDADELIIPCDLQYQIGSEGGRVDGKTKGSFHKFAGLDGRKGKDSFYQRNVYCIEQKFDHGKYLNLSVVRWDPWRCQGSSEVHSEPFSIFFSEGSDESDSQESVAETAESRESVAETNLSKVEPKPISLARFKEQSLHKAFDVVLPAGLKGRLEISADMDGIAYEVLYSKLLHHTTITKINVLGCSRAEVDFCCNLIRNSDTFEEVMFQDVGSLDDQMVQKLFESIKTGRNLKVLDLRTSRYLETWKKSSPGERSNKPSIESEPIFAALKSLESSPECPLETLDFGGNTIVESASICELMATLLSSSLGLKRLSFRACDLTEEALLAVAKHVETNDCLEKLDLSHNAISKEVMEHLVKSKSLRELKLEHCKIDLEIVESLASYLPQMQRLQHLHLDGNDFTWEPLTEKEEAIGAIAMLEALGENDSLLSLEMGEFGMLSSYGMLCCTSPSYNTTLCKSSMKKMRRYLKRNRKGSKALHRHWSVKSLWPITRGSKGQRSDTLDVSVS